MSSPYSVSNREARNKLCRQRLLKDIRELVEEPYPKISFVPQEDDVLQGCLVLFPDEYPVLHLSVQFYDDYPTHPPVIRMDSNVIHPNVYRDFICASVLSDDFSPAYTLKGIAIQLLSFFDSDTLEQEHVDGVVDLVAYRKLSSTRDEFKCNKCNFRADGAVPSSPSQHQLRLADFIRPGRNRNHPIIIDDDDDDDVEMREDHVSQNGTHDEQGMAHDPASRHGGQCRIQKLPNELILELIDRLDDFKDVVAFSRAWPRVSDIVRDFKVIRRRELQCFCLKEGYHTAKLGVGISIVGKRTSSEFDLLSEQAFDQLHIRRSVQQVSFNHWLPLPISPRHWHQVRERAYKSLTEMSSLVKGGADGTLEYAVFTMMNDVVVQLNLIAEKWSDARRTPRHASEKAIDSYFHLFHLLVCVATEDPRVVERANKLLGDFEAGKRSKKDCPNLGHLLVALLISDVPVTESLRKSIVTEAITRNVVWLLDAKGVGMPELSYMERNAVSDYRLGKTFEGSRTSYRLLMFSELFRRIARPDHEKPLRVVGEELFNRLGAPPHGASAHLAAQVRRLHTIDGFPAFMREMGLVNVPSAESFTAALRDTVRGSMTQGYSVWAIGQDEALLRRWSKDISLELTDDEWRWIQRQRLPAPRRLDFFPASGARHAEGNGSRGDRGGRGGHPNHGHHGNNGGRGWRGGHGYHGGRGGRGGY